MQLPFTVKIEINARFISFYKIFQHNSFKAALKILIKMLIFG